ncbi:MAG: hypothetical protein A2516_11385 [Alphaproteobacteria bacterium RIFOXYD12_FULL_60_8]|nr:MAG: hypothetical protein A2516_11385 [Alphaproteobacteria bacterium RIFOXYD12_FULL_60_8]
MAQEGGEGAGLGAEAANRLAELLAGGRRVGGPHIFFVPAVDHIMGECGGAADVVVDLGGEAF